MGHGGQLICLLCGFATDVMFGIGFKQCGVFETSAGSDGANVSSSLRACIPNRIKYDLVKKLLLEKHGKAIAYGYGLYRCSKCGNFHNLIHYTIKHDDGIYEPDYKCRKCAIKLDYLGDDTETEEGPGKVDVSKFPCPKCGKHGLSVGGGIMWD